MSFEKKCLIQVTALNTILSADLLVGVDKEPWDSSHKKFLDKVSKEVGEIVYRQFRDDWLQYQLCKLDVVGFCKKVKLAFRGSRVPLRVGARVLVDEDDRQDFDDFLAGKNVEPKKGSLIIIAISCNHYPISIVQVLPV